MLKKLFKLLFKGLKNKKAKEKKKRARARKRKFLWGLTQILSVAVAGAALYLNRGKIKDKVLGKV